MLNWIIFFYGYSYAVRLVRLNLKIKLRIRTATSGATELRRNSDVQEAHRSLKTRDFGCYGPGLYMLTSYRAHDSRRSFCCRQCWRRRNTDCFRFSRTRYRTRDMLCRAVAIFRDTASSDVIVNRERVDTRAGSEGGSDAEPDAIERHEHHER